MLRCAYRLPSAASELEALIAVQIAATGFAGLKFLQHSQRHLDDAFIGVYGGYATRLLRL
jgi:hypothetical protein